jgi:hypothetical protein
MVYNYSFVYFNLYVFRQQMGRQDSELHDSKHSLLHLLNAEEKCNQLHGKLQVVSSWAAIRNLCLKCFVPTIKFMN